MSPETLVRSKPSSNGPSVPKRESEPEESQVPPRPPYAVAIHEGSAKWAPGLLENTLNNVSLHIRPGQLVAVIGPVGCGKVSLQTMNRYLILQNSLLSSQHKIINVKYGK